MEWIDARRNVAFVPDQQAGKFHPRCERDEPVRSLLLPIEYEFSVAVRVDPRGPNPAVVWVITLLDLRPKAFRQNESSQDKTLLAGSNPLMVSFRQRVL